MPTEFDRFVAAARAERGQLFEPQRPITVACAPAWVDLLGGPADAGGSLALGWPLAVSSFVALQPAPEAVLRIQTADGLALELDLAALQDGTGWPLEYAAVAAVCAGQPDELRAVAAAWVALAREEWARVSRGARILIWPAAGLGQMLSMIVATAQAVVSAYEIHLAPRELALACQTGLIRVAGGAMGALGPLVAVCAAENELLPVHQQPAWPWGGVRLPHGAAIWALKVGDGPSRPPAWAAAAPALAMRLLADAADLSAAGAATRWRGYLANVGMAEFERAYRNLLPAHLPGADYLARYGQPAQGPPVDPAESYPLRAAATLAVEEHLRARTALALLRAAARVAQREDDLRLVGELMAQSHWAQRAAGYGNTHADALAELVDVAGPGAGLYGARAPAATAGATLVVLGRSEADSLLRSIAVGYGERTGLPVAVYGGSAPGCGPAGAREI